MRYEGILEKILGTKSKVKSIFFLIKHNGEYSANAIHKQINLTQRSVSLALKDLETLNIINRNSEGKYFINKHNFFARKIEENFVNGKKEFFNEVVQKIKNIIEPYKDKIRTLVFSKKDGVLIILKNEPIANELIYEDILNPIKTEIKLLFSFDCKIEIINEKSIEGKLLKKWENSILVYGENLKTLVLKSTVEKVNIKKLLSFFDIEEEK